MKVKTLSSVFFVITLMGSGCPTWIPYDGGTYIPEQDTGLDITSNCPSGGSDSCSVVITHTTLNTEDWKVSTPNHIAYANKHGYDYYFRNGHLSLGFFDPSSSKKVEQLGLYWQKIVAASEALNIKKGEDSDTYKYDWVLWLDPDAIFTNTSLTIQNVVDTAISQFPDHANAELFVSKDDFFGPHNEVNAGVFIVKNTPWTRALFENIQTAFPWYRNVITPEQTAIQDVIFGYLTFNDVGFPITTPLTERDYSDKSQIIPQAILTEQRVFNALYPSFPIEFTGRWCPGDFILHLAGTDREDRPEKITDLLQCFNENGENSMACSPDGQCTPVSYTTD